MFFMEDVLKTSNEEQIFFGSLNLDKALRNSTPEEFACIWQRKRDSEIIGMKLESRKFTF